MLLFQECFKNIFRTPANKVYYYNKKYYSTVTLLIYNTNMNYLLHILYSSYLRSLNIATREPLVGHEKWIPSVVTLVLCLDVLLNSVFIIHIVIYHTM